ncbi:MAG TPA: DUF4238 domain-containing protein [Bacteroidales bacterium]|nr:DUF4238 domain-containing protein [Bacteroidales bacterium]
MNDQGQHRISQTYLKQFGFQDINNKWWISTWKIGEEFTSYQSIKKFSKELNIFDLPSKNIKTRRAFEDFSGTLETHYPLIIKEIKLNGQLSQKALAILAQFKINLLCRTVRFRDLIDHLLKSEKRDFFLKEITYYHQDKGKQLIESLKKIRIEYQLNLVIFSVWYYFVNTLTSSNFDYVILKDFDNRGWATTDNPVIIKNNINESTLFSKETEIYFPISKDYCIYIDHRDYNRSNSLRGANNAELAEADDTIHDKIMDLIGRNASKYVINPADLGRYKLSK